MTQWKNEIVEWENSLQKCCKKESCTHKPRLHAWAHQLVVKGLSQSARISEEVLAHPSIWEYAIQSQQDADKFLYAIMSGGTGVAPLGRLKWLVDAYAVLPAVAQLEAGATANTAASTLGVDGSSFTQKNHPQAFHSSSPLPTTTNDPNALEVFLRRALTYSLSLQQGQMGLMIFEQVSPYLSDDEKRTYAWGIVNMSDPGVIERFIPYKCLPYITGAVTCVRVAQAPLLTFEEKLHWFGVLHKQGWDLDIAPSLFDRDWPRHVLLSTFDPPLSDQEYIQLLPLFSQVWPVALQERIFSDLNIKPHPINPSSPPPTPPYVYGAPEKENKHPHATPVVHSALQHQHDIDVLLLASKDFTVFEYIKTISSTSPLGLLVQKLASRQHIKQELGSCPQESAHRKI